ncbi:MAG: L,D-transpeptidase [Acidimicrobiia bacterium]|nr:L,D-transpeptidase [Acidimicrobiia bacterium]
MASRDSTVTVGWLPVGCVARSSPGSSRTSHGVVGAAPIKARSGAPSTRRWRPAWPITTPVTCWPWKRRSFAEMTVCVARSTSSSRWGRFPDRREWWSPEALGCSRSRCSGQPTSSRPTGRGSCVQRCSMPTVAVTASPGGDDVLFTFDNPIPSGGPLVFLVEEFDGLENYRVLLPTRPNGNVGWVSGADVLLTRHNYDIQVRLDDFLLVLSERGVPIFETTVGVAREDAPTPLGRYYTTELLRPPTPNSVYGTYAYGLSGYSEVLTEFAGGEGQLGIHGTNDPSSLGTNVSSGCIRLHNDDISLLVEQIGLPLGVPVEVI